MVALPYTICFCLCGEHVLVLYRSKPPNAKRWNGLGGKIEAGETPLISVQREIMEEAEIDLRQSSELRYAGLVTWANGNDPSQISGGMYTFLAYFAADFPTWPDRPTPEGQLSWKRLDWLCNPRNRHVVSNISHFLPLMLDTRQTREYRCYYRHGIFRAMDVYILPREM